MSRKNVIRLTLIVAAICLIVAAVVLYNSWDYQHRLERNAEIIANNRAKLHVMSAENSLRLHHIAVATQKSGTLSDEDFNWMLTLAQSPMPAADKKARVLLKSEVSSYINLARVFTAAQAQRYFVFGLSLLQSTDTLDKTSGISVMVALHDKQAIPYLQQLLSDKESIVRERAREAIDQLSKST